MILIKVNGICSQYDLVMVSAELVIRSNLIASRSCKMLESCRTEELEFEICVLSKTCFSCKVRLLVASVIITYRVRSGGSV